jgi:hypothetical protein
MSKRNTPEGEMVRDRGFEPLTPSVSRKCSTTELTAQPWLKDREEPLIFVVFRQFREGTNLAIPDHPASGKVPEFNRATWKTELRHAEFSD